MTNEDLRKMFNRLNRRWFGDKLPTDFDLEFSERLSTHHIAVCHPHGVLACDPNFCHPDCERSFIRMDPRFRHWNNLVEFNLLHEMCHLKSLLGERRLATHGPVFQAEMMRLAKAGAFKNLW